MEMRVSRGIYSDYCRYMYRLGLDNECLLEMIRFNHYCYSVFDQYSVVMVRYMGVSVIEVEDIIRNVEDMVGYSYRIDRILEEEIDIYWVSIICYYKKEINPIEVSVYTKPFTIVGEEVESVVLNTCMNRKSILVRISEWYCKERRKDSILKSCWYDDVEVILPSDS